LADQGQGRAAHTREKIVAAASPFMVIADSTKPVGTLRPPIPPELLAFGLSATLRRLHPVALREAYRGARTAASSPITRAWSAIRPCSRLASPRPRAGGPWPVSARTGDGCPDRVRPLDPPGRYRPVSRQELGQRRLLVVPGDQPEDLVGAGESRVGERHALAALVRPGDRDQVIGHVQYRVAGSIKQT
jgi:hypothetical protein